MQRPYVLLLSLIVLFIPEYSAAQSFSGGPNLQHSSRNNGTGVDAPAAARKRPPTTYFEKVVLDSMTTRPNELDIAPDGRVFYIEREGAIKVWNPDTRTTEMVGFIPVKAIHTNGLIGMTLDPDFEKNSWIYLYYSPRGDDTRNELARFTVVDNEIDPASKKVILEVPFDRLVGGGAHSGGSLQFGPNGILFLSIGDNTNPSDVQLSAPLDERPGHEHWDAQRTAANTMSLRGKILRIRPLDGGGYEIPAGNLFPYGAVGRPEIFVMGNRNPYRIAVDPKTGWLYWGDYGPSAPGSEKRGAEGFDEFNIATEPGFYGWPYFNGNNAAFRKYDFAADTSGRYFNPERPINDSPNNTGARVLPPAQPAMIWYPSGPSKEFPEMGVGGRGPMGGDVYRYDPETVGAFGLPPYYDGKLFIMEFMRRWLREVEVDEQGHLVDIKPFLDEMTFLRPFDMEIGPDGSIYMIEWGDNYEGWFNDRAKIIRLKYHGSEKRPPVAKPSVSRTNGPAPLQVTFTGDASYSRNSRSGLTYEWDFDGDHETDTTTTNPTFTYEKPGRYTASLKVTDSEGLSDRETVTIVAGNSAPDVSIDWPLHGGIVDLGEPLDYRVSISDAEDGQIASQDVRVQPQLAHDSHRHRLDEVTGASGSVRFDYQTRHMFIEDEYAAVAVSYTDGGGEATDPLTTTREVILQPRQKDAAFVHSIQGAERLIEGDYRWRDTVETFIDVSDGDHVSYAPVNLRNINAITFRVSADTSSTIEVRLDAPNGEQLGEVSISDDPETTEDNRHFQEVTVPVSDPGGTHELYLVFRGPSTRQTQLLRMDWLRFVGPGVAARIE